MKHSKKCTMCRWFNRAESTCDYFDDGVIISEDTKVCLIYFTTNQEEKWLDII